jgi:hypothetical protein
MVAAAVTRLAAALALPAALLLQACTFELGDPVPPVGSDAGPGGGCPGGTCAATPYVLASGFQSPYALALDASSVFVSAEGSVWRVPRGGGAPVQIASGQPLGIAVDATTVYWGNYDDESIMAVSKNGGTASSVAFALTHSPQDVIATDSYLAWTTDGVFNTVARVPKGGGVIETVGINEGDPDYLATDDQAVYWTDGFEARVRRALIDDWGSPQTVVADEGHPVAIAVDGTDVYWANDGTGLLQRCAKDGGNASPLVLGLVSPGYLAVDESWVYWTDRDQGTVSRVPKAGGEVQVLANDQAGPYGIATDGQTLYWTTFDGDGLLSLGLGAL